MLPEDGPIGQKHVGANTEIFQLYVLTFYVFNKRVHLLVKRILMLSRYVVQQLKKHHLCSLPPSNNSSTFYLTF
jgi:hypothetical protein